MVSTTGERPNYKTNAIPIIFFFVHAMWLIGFYNSVPQPGTESASLAVKVLIPKHYTIMDFP